MCESGFDVPVYVCVIVVPVCVGEFVSMYMCLPCPLVHVFAWLSYRYCFGVCVS